ncbi:MAG: hypothetical protein GF364_05450, partial [Candidatus Lokiarchaeota archaeon]|nr:hypothetical protein [Candidatus Lokiarchaeota archaeon]
MGKLSKSITYDKILEIFSISETETHSGNLLVIGSPQTKPLSIDEIYSILEFAKNGGNVLIFVDEGGDMSAGTNINELVGHFGFKILPNIIFDEKLHVLKQVWPIIRNFEDHPITNDIHELVYASGCSFEILERHEYAEFLDVKIRPISYASDGAKMKVFDPKIKQWKETSAKGAILSLAGQFFHGRFFIIGTPSILSSLNNKYGWGAKDNQLFIENVLGWLLGEREAALGVSFFGDKVQVQMRVDKDMFRWANSPEILEYFGDFSVVVNHALKRMKK